MQMDTGRGALAIHSTDVRYSSRTATVTRVVVCTGGAAAAGGGGEVAPPREPHGGDG